MIEIRISIEPDSFKRHIEEQEATPEEAQALLLEETIRALREQVSYLSVYHGIMDNADRVMIVDARDPYPGEGAQ